MAEKESTNHIFYIGDDVVYLDNNIKKSFAKEYPAFKTTFHRIFLDKKTDEFDILQKFAILKPVITYIDFTSFTNRLFKLLKMIKMEPSWNTNIVCLTSSKEEMLTWSIKTRELTHIKCAEKFNVTFGPYYQLVLKDLQVSTNKNFATAKLNKGEPKIIDMEEPIRITAIAPTYIIAEGNLSLNLEEIITLNTAIPKKAIPSNRYIVKEVNPVSDTGNFLYQYKLEFVFVDEPKKTAIPEGSIDTDIEKINKEFSLQYDYYKERIDIAKNRNLKWVQNNQQFTPRPIKLVLIDSSFSYWNFQKELIFNPKLTIRCQSKLSISGNELVKFKPVMLIYNFVNKAILPSEELPKNLNPNDYLEKENRKILLNELKELISAITTVTQNKDTRIIVFNSHNIQQTFLRDTLEYTNLIATKDQISFTFINNLIDFYQTKDNISSKNTAPTKKSPPKKEEKQKNLIYFLEEGHRLEHATILHKVTLTQLNENELNFDYNRELNLSNLITDFPANMLAQLVVTVGKPFEKVGDTFSYHALINGVDENDKKALRRYINKIFCLDKEVKELAEQDAYEKLNESVALKTQEEEAEKQRQLEQEESTLIKRITPEEVSDSKGEDSDGKKDDPSKDVA